jgi:hypothetical protein
VQSEISTENIINLISVSCVSGLNNNFWLSPFF